MPRFSERGKPAALAGVRAGPPSSRRLPDGLRVAVAVGFPSDGGVGGKGRVQVR